MRLLTIPEVSELLRIPRQRAYEVARLGLLPTVKIGRQVRVDEDKLRKWVDGGGQPLPGGWKREA